MLTIGIIMIKRENKEIMWSITARAGSETWCKGVYRELKCARMCGDK